MTPTPEQMREITDKADYSFFDVRYSLVEYLFAEFQKLLEKQEPVAMVITGKFGNCLAWINGEPDETLQNRTKLFATPVAAPAIPEGYAKDAKRYRWLRDKCTEFENPNDAWIVEAPGDVWDDAIDAAIAAAQGAKP